MCVCVDGLSVCMCGWVECVLCGSDWITYIRTYIHTYVRTYASHSLSFFFFYIISVCSTYVSNPTAGCDLALYRIYVLYIMHVCVASAHAYIFS